MARTVLRGLGASPGVAVGRAVVVREVEASTAPPDQAVALAALEQAAAELGRAAEGLRNAGLADEAEILEANRLMAEDPSLAASVARACCAAGAGRSAPRLPQRRSPAFSRRCPTRCSPGGPRTCASSAAAQRGSRTGRPRSR